MGDTGRHTAGAEVGLNNRLLMIARKRKEGKAWKRLTGGTEDWKDGKEPQSSNLPAFHLASPHIKFTLEIGMYTHSYVHASETFRFGVGFFAAKALTDFHVQTERNPAK